MRDFDWQVLVTLHKTHNISKTAELLYVSQPTLTKRIQIIEDELGIPLIVRSRKGSVFTPEGDRLAQKAETIVAAIQEVKMEAALRRGGTGGVLRLGVPYSYVRYVLPHLLAEYAKLHPGVDVDIVTGLSDDLARRVEDDTIDVCFARYNALDSHLERIDISDDQIYIVANRPFKLEELPAMNCIEFSRNGMVNSKIKRWWNERFSQPYAVKYKVPTGDCAVQMVINGLGYGIFPDPNYFRFEKGLYAYPMTFLDGSQLTRHTCLLYEKANLKTPLLADFVSFIRSTDINALVAERNRLAGNETSAHLLTKDDVE